MNEKTSRQRLELGRVALELVTEEDGVALWSTAGGGEAVVNLVLSPPATPSSDVQGTIVEIVERFDDLVQAAVQFLTAQFSASDGDLPDSDRQAFANGGVSFDGAEAVVWGDGSWTLHFTETSLATYRAEGIGVLFVGASPVGIEGRGGEEAVLREDR